TRGSVSRRPSYTIPIRRCRSVSCTRAPTSATLPVPTSTPRGSSGLARRCGSATSSPEVAGKRLELLKELVPALGKVAVFWNPSDPGSQHSLAETQAAGKALQVALQIMETREASDFDGAFQAARRGSAGAVILLPAPVMNSSGRRIAELALQSRLPT